MRCYIQLRGGLIFRTIPTCAWFLALSLLAAGFAPAPEPYRPYRVALEQILFLHARALEPRNSKRSREEALELARRCADDLQAGRIVFDEACRQLSEDPISKQKEGFIGIFRRGEFTDDFRRLEEEVFALRLGEVSAPVESPLGVHLFRRVHIREWAGSHVLIQFEGARNAPASLKRSRQEALDIARKVLEAARRPGADFAELARLYSEAPDRVQGGTLGIFTRRDLLPPLEKAIAALAVEQVDGPVESDLGWHIVRREALAHARIAHILIRFQGAAHADDVSRTRAEALKLAGEVLDQARAAGADFASLARKFSEEGSGVRGGDIGLLSPGQRPGAFREAALALAVGGVSEVVESPDGFHIIKRLPDD